jgi:hypothetical protein
MKPHDDAFDWSEPMTDRIKDEDLAAWRLVLDKSDMSADDKSYITACLWTQEQIPQIESDEQYEEYLKRRNQLEHSLPPRSDPGWSLAFAKFCRTPNGILAGACGARMIEWEDRDT